MRLLAFLKKVFLRRGSEKEIAQNRGKREQLLSNKNYNYFASIDKKIYHRRGCESLNNISDSNLRAFENLPSGRKYRACSSCFKDEIKKNALLYYDSFKKNEDAIEEKTKAQIIEKEILSLCNEFDMKVEFMNGIACVRTEKTAWTFIYNDRPTQLKRIGSLEESFEERSKESKFLKEKKFPSPLHVIQYICADNCNNNN